MTLKALIFDVDGTLAETEEAHRAAFNDAFAAAGLDWRWDRERYAELLHVGGGRERLRHFIDNAMPASAPQWDDERIATLHADKTARYQRMIAEDGLPLRPGVLRLMEEARQAGLALALATTTSRSNVDMLLTKSFPDGARAWFAAIAAGEDATHKKPAPDVYEVVLERLEVPARDCVAVEDARIGLEAAVAAGLPTLVTPSTYTAGEEFDGALAVLDNLAGLRLDRLRALHGAAGRTAPAP